MGIISKNLKYLSMLEEAYLGRNKMGANALDTLAENFKYIPKLRKLDLSN